MAEFRPQYPNTLPENPFPAVGAGAPWDADILPVHRHPGVPPLPPHRPIPVQLPGDARARAPQNVMVSKWHHDLSIHEHSSMYIVISSHL